MKAAFAVCADRAVGFGAAFLGLALLFSTARRLAPIAAFRAPTVSITSAPVVASRTTGAKRATARPAVEVARPRVALVPHDRRGGRRTPKPHAIARIARDRAPTRTATFVRVAVPSVAARSPVSRAPRPRGVASAKSARSSSNRAVDVGRALLRFGPPVPRASLASRGRAGAAARARTNGRPSTFRLPAHFDTRPSLVVVSDASVSAGPAEDALPTIVARKRRR